jgi:hypothetical protein
MQFSRYDAGERAADPRSNPNGPITLKTKQHAGALGFHESTNLLGISLEFLAESGIQIRRRRIV